MGIVKKTNELAVFYLRMQRYEFLKKMLESDDKQVKSLNGVDMVGVFGLLSAIIVFIYEKREKIFKYLKMLQKSCYLCFMIIINEMISVFRKLMALLYLVCHVIEP